MAQMAPKVLGNTEPKPKRESSTKKWCFTFNNYTEKDYNELIELLNGSNCCYIIGKEKGEQGTEHLQGYIEFEVKQRLSENKNFNKKIHWEQAKGNQEQNINYCSKEKNFIIKGFKIKKPLKILEEKQLYDWQKKIYELCKTEPDDRSIYWFWETKGKVGKSQLAKFLSYHLGAIPIDGCKNDILYCAACFESDIYIFDFERSMEDYISWGAMEKIKNGFYMCAKYESKPIIRNSPHVIVFANFEPDTDKLSKDRWKIEKIK